MHTEKYQLKNGATVITTAVAEAKSTTLFVTVPHGSRHETDAQAGLAHFYEHMVFKGAQKYPDAAAIAQALDRYGAFYNAFTDFEQTAYYAKIDTAHFDTALDVISDYLTHPKLDQADIDRERGVILEEFNMYWDVPRERADMQINELVFGHTPLGRPIIGTKERITSFNRPDFVAWRERHYGADRVTVSVAGAIPKNLPTLLEAAFADLPAAVPVELAAPALITNGPLVKLDERPGEQISLIMAFPSLAAPAAQLPTLQLLRTIMGVSMSSRLFTEIREKRGLCYSIHMANQSFTDTGMIQVAAGLDGKRLLEATEAIWNELKKIATTPPAADELQRAQEFIKGATVLSLEDTSNVAQAEASQWLFEGQLKSLEERFAEIMAVTGEQVTALAAQLFQPTKLGLVLVGPQQDTAAIQNLLQ